MEKLEFRTLTADEIECRVGTVTDKGVSLLMYKDARCDMRLLDEVVGPTNWKREHEVVNNCLYCTVSVWDDDKKMWVSKQDVGVESNTEKEKGQASDAFKRACFNWGIGRELYTCPFVWVNLGEKEWRAGFNGKKQPAVRFKVAEIEYFDRVVTYLRIVDESGATRFCYGKSTDREVKKSKLLEQIAKAQSREELEKLYRDSVEFKNDADVISVCTKRSGELQKAQKKAA